MTILHHDKYLDPPDYPTHGECSSCGEIYDIDDMYERGFDLICEDCIEEYDKKMESEE